MAVRSEPELVREIKRLREELARREREAADKERQLEQYAADLRETFKQERFRSQELKESYRETVRALSNAVDIVRSHHERWDGTGYPERLRGEEIPLAARVFTVADVLDALTTDRPYRPASPMADAREMIRDERGRQFDPRVVDAFMSITDDEFRRIAGEIL